jgi:hypothetical protein
MFIVAAPGSQCPRQQVLQSGPHHRWVSSSCQQYIRHQVHRHQICNALYHWILFTNGAYRFPSICWSAHCKHLTTIQVPASAARNATNAAPRLHRKQGSSRWSYVKLYTVNVRFTHVYRMLVVYSACPKGFATAAAEISPNC